MTPTAARLKAIEECAALLDRFGERAQTRQIRNAILSLRERPPSSAPGGERGCR